ncbi:MAG: hypothetical protein II522_03680, partial [Clostridia bacterium]|nr:hypothetical protein [Clostridia bacterium]
LPGMTYVCGECSAPAKDAASPGLWIRGCGEVNNLAFRLILAMMPTLPGQFDLNNLHIILFGFFRKYFIKLFMAAKGTPTEPNFDAYNDGLFTIPELAEKNLDCDWVEAPVPKLTMEQRIEAIKNVKFLAKFLF